VHKIFLIAGIIFSVLALIAFSHFLKDVNPDGLNGNGEIEITAAPIHEVDIMIAESFPEKIFVLVKVGLPDGCTAFNDFSIETDGNTVNITVTIKRPKDAICPAVYGFFENNIALGSNFVRGETYTVSVNGVCAEFTYPL
jgi:inhibitor of cysteine peptidase